MKIRFLTSGFNVFVRLIALVRVNSAMVACRPIDLPHEEDIKKALFGALFFFTGKC